MMTEIMEKDVLLCHHWSRLVVCSGSRFCPQLAGNVTRLQQQTSTTRVEETLKVIDAVNVAGTW